MGDCYVSISVTFNIIICSISTWGVIYSLTLPGLITQEEIIFVSCSINLQKTYSVVSIPYNRWYSCVGLPHLRCTNEEPTKALTILHAQHKPPYGGLQDDSCLQGPPSPCSPIALRFYIPSLAMNRILWQSNACCLCGSVLVLPIPLASPWRWCMHSWFLKSFLVLYLLPFYRIEWTLSMIPYHPLSPCRIIIFMLNIIFLLTFLDVPLDCELIEGQPMSCSSLYLSCPVQNTFKYVFVLQWIDNGWINTFCWEFC